MLLGQVFERFVKESPVSVMVRGLLEKALCPQILDELFERSAKNQYTRELLFSKGIFISQRTVTHLIDRYDELLSLWLKDHKRLKAIVANQGRVILAIDGMQPEIGHEVL